MWVHVYIVCSWCDLVCHLTLLVVHFFVFFSVQIPLAMVTSLKFIQGQIGNCIVWTSIVLGHPIAIIMYMHDYYILHLQPQEGVGGTM